MTGRVAIVLLCLVASLSGIGPVRGAERLARRISDIPGMPSGVTDVAQDGTGYLWIASGEGLHRYDGFELRPWPADGERKRFEYVATGPDDRVLAGAPSTGLYEVEGTALRRLDGPTGASDGPIDAVYDETGVLWAAWDGRLLRREGADWIDIGGSVLEDEHAWALAPRKRGGVHVGTRSGTIRTIGGDQDARLLADDLGGQVPLLIDDPSGVVAVVRFGPRPGVVRVGDGGVEYLLDYSGRADGLARRGSSVWVAYSTGVWVLHDDGSHEFLGTREGFTGFGSITTDREGGLWMTGVRGVSHYPQPETLIWTELSGLPRVYLRAIHRVSDGYLLMSWRGPMHVDATGNHAREVELRGLFSRDMGCADPWGGVWMKAFARPPMEALDNHHPETAVLVEWQDGRARIRRSGPWYQGDLACDVGPDGTLWILAGGDVWVVAEPGGELEMRARLGRVASESLIQTGLSVDRDGTSVVAAFSSGEICETDLVATAGEESWTCERVEATGILRNVARTRSGRIWVASDRGVLQKTEDGWRRVPGELSELPAAIGLVPSPSGGVWVLGWRERLRVDEGAPGEAPVVVERLGTAHGIPSWQNSRRMLEEDDGTVWLPLYSGLVRVPAAVRQTAPSPPAVTVTRLVADGRLVSPDEPLELRHGDHSLEIRWSALSYRDPTRMRYRMRLDSDAEWKELGQPFVQLAGLGTGRHRVGLGASLDGRTWTDRPVFLEFRVRRAWYMQPWFVAAVNAVVVVAIWVTYRLRLLHLLRLERQRTRIAMDLHDEMGAGLGSVGLLIGTLGEERLGETERRRIGERAAQQIRDLGGSLSDIVWSLRPGTETLDALLLFLRQRAVDLFPSGCGVRVSVDAPEPCPALRLDLRLRRNLQWIAVEALHNAARHAEAERVEIGLRPDGEDWVLSVRDDGSGLPVVDANDGPSGDGPVGGMGRESMRRRAREIGADLAVRSAPGEGTEVSVRFRPGRKAS